MASAEHVQPSVYDPPTISSISIRRGRTIAATWVWGYTSQTDHFAIIWGYTDIYGNSHTEDSLTVEPDVRESTWEPPKTASVVSFTVTPVSKTYSTVDTILDSKGKALIDDSDELIRSNVTVVYINDNYGNPIFYHNGDDLFFTTQSATRTYEMPAVSEPVATTNENAPISTIPDWSSSMQRTYEYYKVDPVTWLDTERIDKVISSSVVRDADADTLGSASFDVAEDVGECYIRTYMITVQNRVMNRTCLGTHLCQTRSVSFDGKRTDISLDGYTALIELKEKLPPLGYAIQSGRNVLSIVSNLVRENIRPPITPGSGSYTLSSNFVSNMDDTWFSYLSDLLAMAGYSFGLDDVGGIILVPKQDFNSLQPIYEYNDDNSSILQPDVSVDRDLFGIPNVLEVIYSGETSYLFSRVVNDDPNSPVSTVNRGREIVQRITDPELYGTPDQAQLDLYARQALRDLSSLEYTLTYTHAYNSVRLNDCVSLNYIRAGLVGIKAKVIRQSIKCDAGGQVEETAIYSTNLWG